MRVILQSLLNHIIRWLTCCLLLRTKKCTDTQTKFCRWARNCNYYSLIPHFIKFFDWQTGNTFFCSVYFNRSVVFNSLKRQASLSITNSQSLLKLMSIKSMMPSNHLILFYPLLLLPSIFPSIKIFSNESAPCIRWPKYRSLSFSIRLSNQYSGLISFRTDQFDLHAVQGTFKSLL